MNRFVIAAALLAVLGACEGTINLSNANLPNHKEACHEGPGAPHADCWTLAPDYCKNHRGWSWDRVHNFTIRYSLYVGSASLTLKGNDADVFLRKFGEAEGIGPFPAGVDVVIAKHYEDYAGESAYVFAGSGSCIVKGMVNHDWPIEAVRPHLSHLGGHIRIPPFLR